MECLDVEECYGDFHTDGMFCQDTCRGVIDCAEVSFCREIEGCVRTPGCQDGQPCAEECAKACEYPGPCMADEQCLKAAIAFCWSRKVGLLPGELSVIR